MFKVEFFILMRKRELNLIGLILKSDSKSLTKCAQVETKHKKKFNLKKKKKLFLWIFF